MGYNVTITEVLNDVSVTSNLAPITVSYNSVDVVGPTGPQGIQGNVGVKIGRAHV